METWTDLLDDYEAAITGLEAALAAGAVSAEQRPWEAPGIPPEAPTEDERQRFGRLRVRAAACEAQLEEALVRMTDELTAVRRTGVAARAYGVVELSTGR